MEKIEKARKQNNLNQLSFPDLMRGDILNYLVIGIFEPYLESFKKVCIMCSNRITFEIFNCSNYTLFLEKKSH